MIQITDLPTNAIHIIITEESLSTFRELVFRATNLWPDAPAEIKSFSDLICHGRVLQDYATQDTSKKNSRGVTT